MHNVKFCEKRIECPADFRRALGSAYDPKGAARPGPPAGFIEYDGQIPGLLAPIIAGGIGHQDLVVLDASQNNEVAAGCEVPFGHKSHNQFALAQCVHNPLRLGGGAALDREAPCLCGAGDQRMVGAALAAPVPVLVGPLRHL